MILNIELITGNVNQVGELDFLLIGHKNPLRKQITQETKSTFKIVNEENCPHQACHEILEACSYKWKKVAAIKFRANEKLSDTQFARISSPIFTALQQSHIKSIGILPPTWRNPNYCALGIIYSLWKIAWLAGNARTSKSLPNIMAELCPDPSNVTFKIISLSRTEYFEEILKNECEIMWNFIEQLCKQQKDNSFVFHVGLKRLRKIPVVFNLKKITI